VNPIVPRINILYTNIGRGHPSYLDGITEALIRKQGIGLVRAETSVFEVSSLMSRLGWDLARWLYQHGSSGGTLGVIYGRLRRRRDYNRYSRLLSLMGRDIRRRFLTDPNPLLVAHPSLVGILDGKDDLLYQHGELVVPRESLVEGASVVFVPTEEVASAFRSAGYAHHEVVTTGLCIEPAMVRQAADCFRQRRERLSMPMPLTGAYYSSGAEPKAHVARLTAAAVSAVAGGQRAIVVAAKGRRLAVRTERAFREAGLPLAIIEASDQLPADLPSGLLVLHTSRREESAFSARFLPYFDYLLAPAHERTSWALGLGLPMFVVGPAVGPFASLNRDLLLRENVAVPLDSQSDADKFGALVAGFHRSGRLVQMSDSGWGRFDSQGFDTIAEYLLTSYGK